MALLELPGKAPSLKLVLSLLEQTSDVAVDWFLVHLASRELGTYLKSDPNPITCKSVFLEATKLFIQDIKTVCETISPDVNPRPLKQYLSQGRGLILISGLQRTVSHAAVFNEELCAVLLSLESFLTSPALGPDPDPASECPLLTPAPWPQCPDGKTSASSTKKRKPSYRSSKVRRRASSEQHFRPGFPDVSGPGPLSRSVGENLTEWETGSPSSDGEAGAATPGFLMSSTVKYIPINYFEYFDSAHLDSDEFSRQRVRQLGHPPGALLREVGACGSRQMVETCLELVLGMMRHSDLSPRTQTAMTQLGVVACNQIKFEVSPVSRAQLVSILCHCILCVRHRPDLASSAPLQTILATLVTALPSLSPECWVPAASCSLRVWRDLSAANSELSAVTGVVSLVTAVLQTLQQCPDTRVMSSLVTALQDLPDTDFVYESVQSVLSSVTSELASSDYKRATLEHLRTLFSVYCYPADQLGKLTQRIQTMARSKNFAAYLSMLEQVMDNLAESEQKWPEPLIRADKEEVKETDRDSALPSSDNDSSAVEENNNRCMTGGENSNPEFRPYLETLEAMDREVIELVIGHLEKVVLRADGDTRHKIALQVLIPYLETHLGGVKNLREEDAEQSCLESVLTILSHLVTQQPTAMALIKNQTVWKLVKLHAISASPLSTITQLVIKSIVLNSGKFIKIRLSEAEAMALQDDENDLINFDQRDRNAQSWLFKQFYHVLIQSSIPIINGDHKTSYRHLSTAWRVARDLVKTLPEFLVFSIERGVMTLALQLVEALTGRTGAESAGVAESVGRVVSFLIFIITNKSETDLKLSNLESPSTEHFFDREIAEKIKAFILNSTNLKASKTLLGLLLDASCDNEKNFPGFRPEVSEDGYEADNSDYSETEGPRSSIKCCADIKHNYIPGIQLFSWGLDAVLRGNHTEIDEKIICLEYLLFKFSLLDLSDKTINKMINDGLLISLFEYIESTAEQFESEHEKLKDVTTFVMEAVGKASIYFLSPKIIKKMFELMNKKTSVQKLMFKLFTNVLTSRVSDYNIPSISIIGSKSRDRLSSTISSDSGLDSNISLSSTNLSLSSSRTLMIKDPVNDLEKDFTVLVRLRIDIVSPQHKDDFWVDLVKIENRCETLGVQVNLVKGLRLTLSNVKGTFAAAETNFQSMFAPGQWTHLVLNIGTVAEGSRVTKTLSAFIDCCRVWDVGLSVDSRINNKVRRDKFLTLTVGQSGGNSANSNNGLDIRTSDVFFLSTTYTLPDIVQDYLTESRNLLSDNVSGTRINLKRLGEKLPDLIGYFLPLVNCESPLSTPPVSKSKVVAHFSPTGLWNHRTFDQHRPCWTLQHGIYSVGGLDSILLLPAAAIDFQLDEDLLSSSFLAALDFVLSDQEMFQIFLSRGGFPLFSHLLKSCKDTKIQSTTNAILKNSGHVPPASGFTPNSKILLYPELIALLMDVPRVVQNFMKDILTTIIELVDEENVYSRFNLNFIKSSGLLTFLLSCLVNLSKEGHQSIPVTEVTSLLCFIPSSHDLIEKLLENSLLLCPPHLLYLPANTRSHSDHSPADNNPADVKYFEKIHSQEVVDLTTILDTTGLRTSTSVPDLRDPVTSLEYLGSEEGKVEEWEVVTDCPPAPPPPLAATAASSCSALSLPSSPLLISFLQAAVTKMRLLSDSVHQHARLSPALLLPLVCHPVPEVHSAALQLMRLMMERRNASHNFDEMFEIISTLITAYPATPPLVEAVLSLVHGHHVNIDIAYEFSMTTYSCLNIQAVTPILPPVLRATSSDVSLCHNFITQIHELAANVPSFLSRLLESNLSQELFSILLQLGANPGPDSDLCGYFESDLLVEDIQNLLRLVIVKYVDQTQAEFEIVLDLLFLAASKIHEHQCGNVTNHLRSSLSLCLEEALFTVQCRASDHNIYRPSHFLNMEDCALHADNFLAPGIGRQKRSDWVGCNLADRFAKLYKFSVNSLSSVTPPLLDEEIGLANGIYNTTIELEQEMSKKKLADPLVKCLRDSASLGGPTLLMLLRSDLSLSNKMGLIRKLDALPNTIPVIMKLFLTPEERETFRLSVISLVSQSLLLDSVDCEMVTRFYGELLSVSVFPEGPGACEPSETIRHKTFQPWQAETERCRHKVAERRLKRAEYLESVGEKLTNVVVSAHDNLMKENLDGVRRQMCRSYDSRVVWRNIVDNQTHPQGLWHNPRLHPKSMVLENISGTSGIYTRLKPSHCGLTKSKYFKDSKNAPSATPIVRPFSSLLCCTTPEEISLADRLGGVETVQTVETVRQVTATNSVAGELVVSGNTVYFVSVSGWNASFSQIEAACRRRHQLKDVALEFFLTSGETHLIVFDSVTTRNSLFIILSRAGVSGKLKSANLEVTTKLWRQGHLTNFQYLLELNRLSGRTFNDLMQHPVMPWILADYTSPHLNLNTAASFRNLRKPIAVQVAGSEEKYVTNYNILSSDGSGLGGVMGPYHFASHYSNTGIVLHYLVRVPPYTGEFIRFQDGNFDLPDRSFHKLATSWLMASELSASDVKELIPQLFYLPEMFLNREGFNFGIRQNGEEVDNVELPPWAPDARTFVKVHRQALESSIVRQELCHWVDLVFGYKQTGQEAVEAVNVFHPATYPSNQEANLDEVEARARQTMIETYGQTPLQLFTSPHPLPMEELVGEEAGPAPALVPVLSTVTGLTFGRYVGAPGQPAPTVVWQQQQGVTVTSLVRLETNEIIGLPARSLLLGKYNTGRTLGQITSGLQLTSSRLMSWGHSDNCLHSHVPGETDTDLQISANVLAWDPIVSGTSHPRVASVWLGHQSGMVSVYGLSSPGLATPGSLHGHTDLVTSITLCPEFGVAVTSSQDRSVITWDLHSQHFLHCVTIEAGGHGPVYSAISGKSGDIAVAAESSVFLFSINLTPVTSSDVGDRVSAVTFSNEEEGVSINCVAVGLVTGQVKLLSGLDLKQLRVLSLVSGPASPVSCLVYSQDSQNLAVAYSDGTVTILEKSGNKGMNKTPRYLTMQ